MESSEGFIVTIVDPGDPWPTDRLHWDYNPLGWLKAKAVDDKCENLWRIHNNLYDLSKWVNKHPGEKKISNQRNFGNNEL